MHKHIKILGILIFLLLSVQAHTFWLQPSSFQTVKNQIIKIKILVGHVKEAEEYTRNPEHIKGFYLHDRDEKTRIVGFPGRSPAGFLRLTKDGIYTISYESIPNLATLPQKKFSEYLQKEALVDNIKIPDKKIIQEHYIRCAKSLINIGKNNSYAQKSVGLPLELCCETNPFICEKDQSLSVKLLYKNKPFANQKIRLISLEDYKETVQTTDSNGRVQFKLIPGKWLLATIYIEHTSMGNIDFKSYWASLSFSTEKK